LSSGITRENALVNISKSVRNGHPLICEEEIITADGVPQDGGLVDVFPEKPLWIPAFITMPAR
jgi:hypothetical protein